MLPLPVIAADITAVVPLVTDAIVVLVGMPVPVIFCPTSAEVNARLADVIVADEVVVVTSAATRVTLSHSSMLLMLQAGMPVKDTVPGDAELVIEPPLALPQIVTVVVSWRA